MTPVDKRGAVIVVLLAGVLFGTTGAARIFSDVQASSTSIAAARLGIGAIGLVAVTTMQRGAAELIALWKRPRVWIMGVSVATYMATFFAAVQLAGAAVASLVSISLAPLLAGTIARMFGSPWPGRIWAISTALAVVGIVLLSAPTSSQTGDHRVLGALSAAVAAAAYAFYTVVGARLVDEGSHATDGLAASFSIGAVLLFPFLAMDFHWMLTPHGLALALWLGVASTTLSYILFGVGITHLAPGVVATLLLSEPFVATMFGVFLLNEPMALRGWFGCILILIGLLMVSRNERKNVPPV